MDVDQHSKKKVINGTSGVGKKLVQILLWLHICVKGVKPSQVQTPALFHLCHGKQVTLIFPERPFPHSGNGGILISSEGLLQGFFVQQIFTEP